MVSNSNHLVALVTGFPGVSSPASRGRRGGGCEQQKSQQVKSVRWGVGINIVPGEGLRLASPQLIPFPLLLVQKDQIVYC